MHMITILIGSSSWIFTYREPSDADKAYKAIAKVRKDGDSDFEIEDDFGCKASLAPGLIYAVQRTDVIKNYEGQAALGLIQTREQMKFQQMAQSDPQLMFLSASKAPVPGQKIIRPV